MRNFSKITAILVIGGVFLCVDTVRAQRKYTLGISLDALGGASNESGQIGPELKAFQPGLHAFYSFYPSINLSSEGQHSTYDLHYSLVVDRYHIDPTLTSTSHSFTGNFAAQLGRRTHIRLTDTLNTVPDYSLLNVIRGTAPSEGFQYIFEPQLYQRTNLSNNAGMGLDIDLNEKSYLTFEGSGGFRHYEKGAENRFLSDQIRTQGSFAFSHRHSSRLSWGLKYTIVQNDYDLFPTSRSHSGTFIMSGTLSPTWDLTLEAGPSFAEKRESVEAYVGYKVNVNLARQMRTNRFSAGYAHDVADSTGLGSSTENHRGILDFSQMLGAKTLLSFQALAFKQNQRNGNDFNFWGAQGSVSLTWQLGRYWVADIGTSYMTYIGRPGLYEDYASKRIYGGIGLRLPELWRAEK